jgi:hypothetical protein
LRACGGGAAPPYRNAGKFLLRFDRRLKSHPFGVVAVTGMNPRRILRGRRPRIRNLAADSHGWNPDWKRKNAGNPACLQADFLAQGRSGQTVFKLPLKSFLIWV